MLLNCMVIRQTKDSMKDIDDTDNKVIFSTRSNAI